TGTWAYYHAYVVAHRADGLTLGARCLRDGAAQLACPVTVPAVRGPSRCMLEAPHDGPSVGEGREG
ncbi:hypothetical protein KI387_020215, partial [Taxus chinensis]